jgi:SAM-dependent methyltransferase
MAALYDAIGHNYQRMRRPDPRIGRAILQALEGTTSVLNVGAGTGSYEPADRFVAAVEPSTVMIRQRPRGAPPVVQAIASELPFRVACFDAALAVLTIHHWPDWRVGLRELRRVSRGRVVLLTYDPLFDGFWLVRDYFPEISAVDLATMPLIDDLRVELGVIDIHTIEIPHDCTDGFLGAYWRRPHEYLRPDVRSASSSFSKIANVDSGLARLRDDLASGDWNLRYGHLLARDTLDVGYRLITTLG